MFHVNKNFYFKRVENGGVMIFQNGKIITSISQDDWISILTHMASFENRDLAETHQIAEMFHTGEPRLRIDPPTKI